MDKTEAVELNTPTELSPARGEERITDALNSCSKAPNSRVALVSALDYVWVSGCVASFGIDVFRGSKDSLGNREPSVAESTAQLRIKFKKSHMDLKLPPADSLVRQDLSEGDRQAVSEKPLAGLTLDVESFSEKKKLLERLTLQEHFIK